MIKHMFFQKITLFPFRKMFTFRSVLSAVLDIPVPSLLVLTIKIQKFLTAFLRHDDFRYRNNSVTETMI